MSSSSSTETESPDQEVCGDIETIFAEKVILEQMPITSPVVLSSGVFFYMTNDTLECINLWEEKGKRMTHSFDDLGIDLQLDSSEEQNTHNIQMFCMEETPIENSQLIVAYETKGSAGNKGTQGQDNGANSPDLKVKWYKIVDLLTKTGKISSQDCQKCLKKGQRIVGILATAVEKNSSAEPEEKNSFTLEKTSVVLNKGEEDFFVRRFEDGKFIDDTDGIKSDMELFQYAASKQTHSGRVLGLSVFMKGKKLCFRDSDGNTFVVGDIEQDTLSNLLLKEGDVYNSEGTALAVVTESNPQSSSGNDDPVVQFSHCYTRNDSGELESEIVDVIVVVGRMNTGKTEVVNWLREQQLELEENEEKSFQYEHPHDHESGLVRNVIVVDTPGSDSPEKDFNYQNVIDEITDLVSKPQNCLRGFVYCSNWDEPRPTMADRDIFDFLSKCWGPSQLAEHMVFVMTSYKPFTTREKSMPCYPVQLWEELAGKDVKPIKSIGIDFDDKETQQQRLKDRHDLIQLLLQKAECYQEAEQQQWPWVPPQVQGVFNGVWARLGL